MANDEGRGVLFVNNKKEKDTHPDYTGKVTIGGVEKRLAAWKKEGRERGTKFLSIQISDFRDGPSTGQGNTGSTAPNIPRDTPAPVNAGSDGMPF